MPSNTMTSMRASYPSFRFSVCLALCLSTVHLRAQDSTSSAIVRDYQDARTAFASKDYQKSAELFRSVSRSCVGSELALQCDFFSALSEWNRNPSQQSIDQLTAWQANFELFQEQAIAVGRRFDMANFSKWNASAQCILAKWDRGLQQIDQAEKRLRSFLNYEGQSTSSVSDREAPECWLELGSLFLENKKNDSAALECFRLALEQANGAVEIRNRALLGCASVCWSQQQLEEARAHLNNIDRNRVDENLAIQLCILEFRISKSLGEVATVAKPLQPAVEIALAGNPHSAVLLELACILLQSNDDVTASGLLLQVTKRHPRTPEASESRVLLAQIATDHHAWKEAQQWSNEALTLGCPERHQQQTRLIRSMSAMELGQLKDAQHDLEYLLAIANLDIPVQISARFRLAESLYRQGLWKEAEVHWKWLLSNVDVSKAKEDSKTAPWYAVVLLRTAELHALRRNWPQAESIVLRIRDEFFECSNRAEVDYLYARCLISRADFDSARKILQSVVSKSKSDSLELVARSHWMTGETFLMQRRFSEAHQAYRSVLEIPKQAHWHSAALLQIGQCAESMNDLVEARNAYERLVNDFQESPYCSIAQERLSKLQKINVARQNGPEPSGNKR